MSAGGACDDDLLLEQSLGDVHLMGGVVDADVERLLVGPAESPLLQPHRQPRASTGRVDHQVGSHTARLVAGLEEHPDHALLGRLVPGLGDAAPDQFDVRDRERAGADLPLEVRPAGHVRGERILQRGARAEDVPGGAEGDAVGPVLEDRHSGGHHALEQSGEQLLELRGAPRHQEMHVAALRDGRAVAGTVGQFVALVDGDAGVVVGQHSRGAQPAQTGADDDGVISQEFPHGGDGTWCHMDRTNQEALPKMTKRWSSRSRRLFYKTCFCV